MQNNTINISEINDKETWVKPELEVLLIKENTLGGFYGSDDGVGGES